MRAKSVCVFAGTREGVDPAFLREARRLGASLASANIRLVYGGGGSGLMGAISDAAVSAGGQVTGVLAPGFEMAVTTNPGVTVEYQPNVALRKHYMGELADAFVALPGGYGTIDEIFDVIISRLAHEHAKPLVLLEVNDFWNDFECLCKRFVATGFADPEVLDAVEKVPSADAVLKALA